jgi:hypothetical protein
MFTFASQFNFRHFMIPSLPRLFRADPVAAAQAPPSPQRAKRQRAGDPDSATACGSMEARCARDFFGTTEVVPFHLSAPKVRVWLGWERRSGAFKARILLRPSLTTKVVP